MTTVLITRTLNKDDELLKKLELTAYKLEGISFISFEAIPFDEIPKTDWLFFYSKNAVHYFFSQPNDNELLKTVKIAAIGKGTAEAIRQMGRLIDFVGDGQPEQVAKAFLQVVTGQSVLFPKALNSNNTVRRQIEKFCECYDLIVYKNSIAPQKLNKHYDIIVFTSPLNVEGFYSLNPIEQGSQIISIGPTTTQKLKDFKITDVIEANKPDVESIIERIVEKHSL